MRIRDGKGNHVSIHVCVTLPETWAMQGWTKQTHLSKESQSIPPGRGIPALTTHMYYLPVGQAIDPIKSPSGRNK